MTGPAMTFHDLAAHIDAVGTLTTKERQQCKWAILKVAAICKCEPSAIICNPPDVGRLFDQAPWQLAGIKRETWDNAKSLVTKAMKYAGIDVYRRKNFKAGPEWDVPFAHLDERARQDMNRFAGWCTAHRILPTKVGKDVFMTFLDYCIATTPRGNARVKWQVVRRIWNKNLACLEGAGYPLIPTTEPRWRGMKRADLPESLQKEMAEFEAWMGNADPFGDDHKILRVRTRTNYLNELRCYVSRLVEAGVPIEELSSLSALVRTDRIKRALDLLLALRGKVKPDDECRSALGSLLSALMCVAKYLKVPADHYGQIKKFIKKLGHRKPGMTDKNRKRLEPFMTPDILQKFLNLPRNICQRHHGTMKPNVRQALEVQLAAVLELLIHLPMRIGNAAALDLVNHISRPVGGKPGPWRIHIPGDEVKNDVPIYHKVNESSSALLEHYASKFRPVLAKGLATALFVTQQGKGKTGQLLGRQLTEFMKRELGLTWHPHLIRHLTGYLFLRENPGQYSVVQRFLRHKKIDTTIAYYTGLEEETDQASYDDMIARLRDGTGTNGQEGCTRNKSSNKTPRESHP